MNFFWVGFLLATAERPHKTFTAGTGIDAPHDPQMLIRLTPLCVTDTEDALGVEALVDSVEYAGGELLAVVTVYGQKLALTTTEMVKAGGRIHVAITSSG